MTERAKQFIDALRNVAHDHNQSVAATLYQLDPDLWPLNVRVDPDGTVKKVVAPSRAIKETIRTLQGWEGLGMEREMITDEQIAGPNLVLRDEIPTKAR